MIKHNWTFGGIGLAAACLAAAALSGCTEYLEARKGAPTVIGVVVADVNFNEAVPVDPPGTCSATSVPPVPYPEPDANRITPGLCGGILSLCPVPCYPPRTGPAFAPTYTGGDSATYPCDTTLGDARCVNGSYTTSVPAGQVYVIPQARAAAFTDLAGNTFQFAQIRILFNVLMDGPSIQPNPAACAAPPGGGGAALTITANGVADNVNWTVCYVPGSPTPAWGSTMTFTPTAGALTAGTTYHITGTVSDQNGAALPIDVTVTGA